MITFLVLLISSVSRIFAFENSPTVQTPLGGIRGSYQEAYSGRKYEAYEGIPYALPPTSEKRFQPPEPIQQWSGNLSATKIASKCIQYSHLTYDVEGDEDCLYLNVYAPAQRTQSLPVLFYIHGGCFQFDSARTHPLFLLDRDVIFVSINYRLGPFGFLSTEDDNVLGNMGLKDQNMALRWTSENIQYFGGDPKRITLIGISAGSASVHYHYLSPLSKGLFQNGISFSGATFGPGKQTEKKNPREKAEKLAAVLGCPTENIVDMVKCLQYRPARTVSAATRYFMPWLYNPFTPFGPVVERTGDKPFVDRSPIEIISSGDVADVPWFAGVVSEEGLYPASEFIVVDKYMEDLDKNWEKIAPHLLDYNFTIPLEKHAEVARQIRNHYLGDKPINKENYRQLIYMIGDRLYVFDAEKAARLQAKVNKSPVHFWYYSYRATNSSSQQFTKTNENLGVGHGDDISLIFKDNWNRSAKDRAMQVKLIDFVVSVAEKGYPHFGLEFEWKRVDPDKEELEFLHFSGPEDIKMDSNDNLAQKRFWSTIDFDENKLPPTPYKE